MYTLLCVKKTKLVPINGQGNWCTLNFVLPRSVLSIDLLLRKTIEQILSIINCCMHKNLYGNRAVHSTRNTKIYFSTVPSPSTLSISRHKLSSKSSNFLVVKLNSLFETLWAISLLGRTNDSQINFCTLEDSDEPLSFTASSKFSFKEFGGIVPIL